MTDDRKGFRMRWAVNGTGRAMHAGAAAAL